MPPQNEHNQAVRPPAGSVYVVDSSPLNWLFVLFHTVEEAVRTDRAGRIVPSLAEQYEWVGTATLELRLRKGVTYHNGEYFTSDYPIREFQEIRRWLAPHPPGTWVNLPEGTTLERIDAYTIRFHFPKRDSLASGKLRGHHYVNMLFWEKLGFGYKKLGTGEGHW